MCVHLLVRGRFGHRLWWSVRDQKRHVVICKKVGRIRLHTPQAPPVSRESHPRVFVGENENENEYVHLSHQYHTKIVLGCNLCTQRNIILNLMLNNDVNNLQEEAQSLKIHCRQTIQCILAMVKREEVKQRIMKLGLPEDLTLLLMADQTSIVQ